MHEGGRAPPLFFDNSAASNVRSGRESAESPGTGLHIQMENKPTATSAGGPIDAHYHSANSNWHNIMTLPAVPLRSNATLGIEPNEVRNMHNWQNNNGSNINTQTLAKVR
eukprot:GEMP01141102.1.p1 GENE.GEMP01141102.1~~GEMP01141102.1.p1  ORF type:complete len:110 (+),score=11.18 GEMP01141102.1:26-355(+)